jgi:EAL domain-containing protein (putative c-di-GMP-specific phosphodiesterase class I)
MQSVIYVAEKTGLIHQIGDYVIESALFMQRKWEDAGINIPLMSINISAEQLKNKDIVNQILGHLRKYDIKPSKVQLEMTETAMVLDIELAGKILRELQSYGIQIALDDFGTGQSSLSHILHFNPDAIKIDRSFTKGLGNSRSNQALVASVVELGNRIGVRVIAEGVETQEQLETLYKFGCTQVQGYLFAAPLTPAIFEDWIQMFGIKSPIVTNLKKSA